MGRPSRVPRRAARYVTSIITRPPASVNGNLAAACELPHVPGMRALVYAVGLAATSCSSRPDVVTARQLPAAVKAQAAQVVAANTQLALAVYHQLPGGNALFSPFSISTAFAMLDAGAAADTDSELRQAMQQTLPTSTLQTVFGALLTSLGTGRSYDNYTLVTADRLFGQQGEPFEATFLDITKTTYQSELVQLDFAGGPSAALATINEWASTETGGKVATLFPTGSITGATLLVLASANVFQGKWATAFDASATANTSFAVDGQAAVSVPMMHSDPRATCSLASLAGGTLVLLPFGGGDLSFMALVPTQAGGLAALEDGLTTETLTAAVAAAVPHTACTVTLPKFTINASLSLKAIMTTLGAADAFTANAADFSGIDGAMDLYVQDAFHDALVTVDEQGTEASGSGSGSGQTVVQVDHSFAYGIYDNVTGSLLFFGRMLDPSLAPPL